MNTMAILDLVRSIVLFAIFLRASHYLRLGRNKLSIVFFTLAIASILLSDLYWLAYDILRPETRMPFAANEISEWALFLLLGATIKVSDGNRYGIAKIEKLCAVIFTVGNVALWIAWSGEWIQDILTGLAFGYFLWNLVEKMKWDESYTRWQWILLGVDCLVLIAGQVGTFLVPEVFRQPLDYCCYVLLFATAGVFIARSIIALAGKDEHKQSVTHSFAAFAWIVVTMYMSAEPIYFGALSLSIVCFAMMWAALVKEVAKK